MKRSKLIGAVVTGIALVVAAPAFAEGDAAKER